MKLFKITLFVGLASLALGSAAMGEETAATGVGPNKTSPCTAGSDKTTGNAGAGTSGTGTGTDTTAGAGK